MYDEFEKLLLDSDEIKLMESGQGPSQDTNGYYFDKISIHVREEEIFFFTTIKFKDMKDCPPGHDLCGVDDDGNYFVTESVPADRVIDSVPEDIRNYMIWNMELF